MQVAACPRAPFAWMNDVSRQFLGKDYLLNGQSGEDRVAFIANKFGERLKRPDLAARFHDYMSRGWYSLSSPVWSNYGLTRGLPISCFGSYVEDDMRSILKTHAEIGMMSKYGGGTSAYLNPLRPRGSVITDNGHSAGGVNFALLFDTEIRVVSQGSSRRGECAVYWDIDHPDVSEALTIRHPESEIQKLSYGLCIRDEWMRSLIAGDQQKRDLWAKVIKARMKTGYPYLIFIDNANNAAPEEYRLNGLSINHSNLCTEIFLSNGSDESFVCCLSSMNMLRYDEWKDTDAVEVMVYFLDTVMSEFIDKARGEYGFERAVQFAERQRALGLGQIGWHSYLMSKMVPYDSIEANSLAAQTSKRIKEQAFAASAKMASELGEPHYLKNRGRRHMTLTAIAPTQSSSAILEQVSEGIECMIANFAIKDKQKVKYTYRNPFLLQILERRGKNTPDVLDSIFSNKGSVQHLDFLDAREKAVFRTLREISPMAVVQQAAARQPYVCQGQSLNLLIDPEADLREVNKVYIAAWELGLKSLYYQKNVSAAQEFVQNLTSCTACEG